MADPHRVIYSAANSSQAHLLKEYLGQRGIPAFVQNEALQGAVGELPPGMATSPIVVVASGHAEQARPLVMEFERTLRSGRPARVADLVPMVNPSWPTCAACGRHRQTVCPFCEEAGHHLPLSEFPLVEPIGTDPLEEAAVEGSLTGSLTVICPVCDEPYIAQFYRHCEWCGHDSGTGMVVQETWATPLNPRERFVIGALIGTAIAMLAYFAWLYRA